MKYEWVYYVSNISETSINNIVERGLSKQLNNGTVANEQSAQTVDTSYRRSKIHFFDEELDQDLFNLVYRLGVNSNNFNFGFDINLLQALQFSIYDSKDKGKYDWHKDTDWTSQDMYHRKLSVVIQLSNSDEYTGGELEIENANFTSKEKADMRKKGSVIVFPSFITHRVTPVTKGKRMSLIGWLVGAKFR